ncbi:hypothetical protein [Gilliamella sp. N-G2]|jgi:hypothetical protein|uniref:hypothetical protein n=1 Tax=Gilliamella sp. N-G2 TaxID=1970471 RepID=UPI000A354B61|nr:hypothetical protein [Gilliamella sp. N-G2]OTQ74727.1 hypothetical protein B6C99_02940 [Gilliamella sp. N-G2]
MNKILTFHSNNEKPKTDCKNKIALLYNPCDGYHLAEWISFNDNDEFEGFYSFKGNRFSDNFYTLWAILPDFLEN